MPNFKHNIFSCFRKYSINSSCWSGDEPLWRMKMRFQYVASRRERFVIHCRLRSPPQLHRTFLCYKSDTTSNNRINTLDVPSYLLIDNYNVIKYILWFPIITPYASSVFNPLRLMCSPIDTAKYNIRFISIHFQI